MTRLCRVRLRVCACEYARAWERRGRERESAIVVDRMSPSSYFSGHQRSSVLPSSCYLFPSRKAFRDARTFNVFIAHLLICIHRIQSSSWFIVLSSMQAVCKRVTENENNALCICVSRFRKSWRMYVICMLRKRNAPRHICSCLREATDTNPTSLRSMAVLYISSQMNRPSGESVGKEVERMEPFTIGSIGMRVVR